MKNKKGFTLIELLAVIVILAIIALIATPIVLNIINNSKKSSDERSAELYVDAVEKAVVTKNLNGEFNPEECSIEASKVKCNGKELNVEVNGKKPTSGRIILKNGKVTSGTTLTFQDFTASVNKNNKIEISNSNKKTYKNGEVVYFNVTTGSKCTNYTESQSNTGVKSGCMKFYVFNYDGGDTVNLLLDHNTTDYIAWNSDGSNKKGPDSTFLDQLKADTDTWKGTETPSNYTLDQSAQESKAKYTINYSGYKARIITAQEVAQITGNTSWDETTAKKGFFFDTNTDTESSTCKSGNTTGCKYSWLYDRTSSDCEEYGCSNNSDKNGLIGYWTISAAIGFYYDSAWLIRYNGDMDGGMAYVFGGGIRPVIEVSKSKLS